MLKKEFRLSSPRLNKSKNIEASSFKLKTSKNNLDKSRFAFVVSKKTDKRAVVRNRLKRKLRACVEQLFDRISVGYDFVFYPKLKSTDEKYDDLLKEVESTLAKQDLIK